MNPLTRRRLHYNWHWQWDYGNGESGGQGPHQVDIARWGMGLKDLGKSVFSYGGRIGYEDAGETPNTQFTLHDFGDRAVIFEVRGLKSESLQGATVGTFFYGTKGYALHGGRDPKLSPEDGYDGGVVFDADGQTSRLR
jgi:predicted dehydrogenase